MEYHIFICHYLLGLIPFLFLDKGIVFRAALPDYMLRTSANNTLQPIRLWRPQDDY